MTSRLRVGILGAGAFASRRHLPELVAEPRVEVVAACRRDPEALRVFADHFGIAERYVDWTQMLDNANLDAVLIATPHNQHVAQTEAALGLGLHVLLEKPMALTGSDARMLRDLAISKGCVLAVAFNPPYWSHTRALRAGISTGRIGPLETASLSWIGNVEHVFGKAPQLQTSQAAPPVVAPTMFRADAAQNGGGQLMDGGGHLISELLWVSGQRASEVFAQMDSTPDDMRSLLSVKLDDGLLASITSVGNSSHLKRRLSSKYFGAIGTAEADGSSFSVTWIDADGARETHGQDPIGPTPVGDWLKAIESGEEPQGSARHAAHVTEVLEAAYLSATTGTSIILPLD